MRDAGRITRRKWLKWKIRYPRVARILRVSRILRVKRRETPRTGGLVRLARSGSRLGRLCGRCFPDGEHALARTALPWWGSRGGVPADGAQMRMTRTVLNPDSITTAWNKDRTKILHSHSRNHSPPARPG